MANYTPIIFILLGFTFNYLLLYQKNKIMHDILFISVAISSFYISYSYIPYRDYMVFSILLIVIGLISFLYSALIKAPQAIG